MLFRSERTEATGHADHFWAKALAVQAGTKATGPAAYGGEDPEQARHGLGRPAPAEEGETSGLGRLFGGAKRLFRRAANG